MAEEVRDLEQLLERVEEAVQDHDPVTVEGVMEAVGSRSFGPLLLLAGVVLFSPLSGIPGMPTMMSIFVLLIAVQLLFRRRHFWLPNWLLQRTIERNKLRKALQWLAKPARFVDRFIRPRLKPLTHSGGTQLVASVCILIALTTPLLEVLPFAASSAGAAVTAFGLSLIAEDGALTLVALIVATMTFGGIVYGVL